MKLVDVHLLVEVCRVALVVFEGVAELGGGEGSLVRGPEVEHDFLELEQQVLGGRGR